MGESAHKAWKENFQWEKIANRYEELYMALLRGEDISGRFNAPPEITLPGLSPIMALKEEEP